MKGSARSGRVAVGHPVDVGSGAQFTAAHDVEVTGVMPMTFRRTYDTSTLSSAPGPLGPGWTLGLDATLHRDLDGYTFVGHDGVVATFDDPSDMVSAGLGSVLSPADSMELRREGDDFVVLHWHDIDAPTVRFVFRGAPDRLRLARYETAPCAGLRVSHDALGRLASVEQDQERSRLRLTYDSGRLVSLSLSAPGCDERVVASYRYDAVGRLVAVADAAGAEHRYAYDAEGRLIEEVTRGGAVWRMRYDPRGRCVEAGGSDGRGLRRFTYFDGLVTEVRDGQGHVTLYELNDVGQVTREIAPDGGVRSTRFDDYRRVIARVGPLGDETLFAYDPRGRLVKTTFPNGAVREVEWNDDHQPVLIREGASCWRIDYVDGLPTRMTDPLGAIVVLGRDRHGQLESMRSVSGNLITVSLSDDGRTRAWRDSYGLILEEKYNAWNLPTEQRDDAGVKWRYTYDARGLLGSETDALGRTRHFEYDADGLVCGAREPGGETHRMERDPYGVLVRERDARGGLWCYEVDGEGRRVAVQNPRGERVAMQRDALGRIVAQAHFDGLVERFTYDLGGRVTLHHKPNGVVVEHRYDPAGNLLEARTPDRSLLTQTFDDWGRALRVVSPDAETSFEYDLLGRVVEERCGDHVVRYRRDAAGAVTSREVEGATCGALRFRYDPRGRLRAIVDAKNREQLLWYGPGDVLVRRDLGPVTEECDFDALGRMTHQRVSTLIERHYRWNEGGQLATIHDASRGTRAFQYDEAGALVSADGEQGARRYLRDAAGALVGEGDQRFHVERGGRVAATPEGTLSRDADGRVIAIDSARGRLDLQWDERDQLVSSRSPEGVVTRYGYDGLGRRIWKQTLDRRTEFTWAGDDLAQAREHDAVVDFATAGGHTYALWRDGAWHPLVTAAHGRPHEALDERGAVAWHGTWEDWGRLVAETPGGFSLRLRLPGQYFDAETGLHYNRFRYHAPDTGQFLTRDPEGYAAGFDAWSYAPDALNWSDLLGLVCGKGAGQFSVYVLERGKPPQIVYVGITEQAPRARMLQHRADGKNFTHMRVVSNGLCYRGARDLEGSALHHAHAGNLTNVHNSGLLNATRSATPGFYHSYPTSPSSPRTLQTASTVNSSLSNNLAIEK